MADLRGAGLSVALPSPALPPITPLFASLFRSSPISGVLPSWWLAGRRGVAAEVAGGGAGRGWSLVALPSLPPISPLQGSTSAHHPSRPRVLEVVGPGMDVPRGGQGWEDGRRQVFVARNPELPPISALSGPPLPSASSSASRRACGLSGEGRSWSVLGVWASSASLYFLRASSPTGLPLRSGQGLRQCRPCLHLAAEGCGGGWGAYG